MLSFASWGYYRNFCSRTANAPQHRQCAWVKVNGASVINKSNTKNIASDTAKRMQEGMWEAPTDGEVIYKPYVLCKNTLVPCLWALALEVSTHVDHNLHTLTHKHTHTHTQAHIVLRPRPRNNGLNGWQMRHRNCNGFCCLKSLPLLPTLAEEEESW